MFSEFDDSCLSFFHTYRVRVPLRVCQRQL